ncbi:retropepsin-like aspartic protease [Pedobacter montanisoli]|uniref:Retroviral-like aspartic protease family protein n=1 Tax=Pedobacter montanisoli TaxID=2923277 RepID=A0ABS9ZX05_9SPHI|nr:retropepsin-like aspartic protease [Pedobacter montanisoli]MCJ0742834.1 retroviral-like aspartic protease family protein [Pedobacter montanisoli]
MRTVSVPLHLINLQNDGFHLLVEIVVFNEKVFAVLDTGASRTVLDQSLMKRHLNDLVQNSETQAATIFSSATTIHGIIPVLKIGSLKLKNYEAVAIDLQSVSETYLQLGHPEIHGIIGGDILMKYHAKIDYKSKILRLYV